MTELKDENFVIGKTSGNIALPFITCNEETKRKILKDQERLRKLKQILDIDTVGWASPKVLIDTIKREVIYK